MTLGGRTRIAAVLCVQRKRASNENGDQNRNQALHTGSVASLIAIPQPNVKQLVFSDARDDRAGPLRDKAHPLPDLTQLTIAGDCGDRKRRVAVIRPISLSCWTRRALSFAPRSSHTVGHTRTSAHSSWNSLRAADLNVTLRRGVSGRVNFDEAVRNNPDIGAARRSFPRCPTQRSP